MAREVAFQFFSAKSFGSAAAAKCRRAQFPNTPGHKTPVTRNQQTRSQEPGYRSAGLRGCRVFPHSLGCEVNKSESFASAIEGAIWEAGSLPHFHHFVRFPLSPLPLPEAGDV